MDADVEVSEPKKREPFFKRQFSREVSRGQTIFDLIFGIIAPILTLIFDPFLFRVDESCNGIKPFVGSYTLLAYSAIALGILALAIWLSASARLKAAAAFFAGVMFAGTLFAGAIGIRLLPLSVVGLLYVIGALGFIPFFTAFVYLRNGIRASAQAFEGMPSLPKALLNIAVMMVAAVLVLGLPTLAHLRATEVIETSTHTLITNPTTSERSQAIARLKQFNDLCLGLCRSMIYDAFFGELLPNPEQDYETLKAAYAEVTGIEIQECADV